MLAAVRPMIMPALAPATQRLQYAGQKIIQRPAQYQAFQNRDGDIYFSAASSKQHRAVNAIASLFFLIGATF